MLRLLRWSWPIMAILLAIALSVMLYVMRPQTNLDLVVVDKTVPFQNHLEHRSFFWLLDHLNFKNGEGQPFDPKSDYFGPEPGAESGDPPVSYRSLEASSLTATTDLLYLADTYGVYEGDLESDSMKAALERSPKVYGGLTYKEATLIQSYVRSGGFLVAEFNSFASPTPADAREVLEETLGVRWTRWIGRYFADLSTTEEIPQWMRENYERIHEQPWEFSGPGWVILKDDSAIEVLEVGTHVARKGLLLSVTQDHPWTRNVRDQVAYPYWFDVLEVDPETKTLMQYEWDLTPEGEAVLAKHQLPIRFPAVTYRATNAHDSPYGSPNPRTGHAVYFAGDFADNPLPTTSVPLAGYTSLRQSGEAFPIAPSGPAFFWRVYTPLMKNILDHAASR